MMIVFYTIVGLGLGFVGFQLAQFSLLTSSPKSKLKNDLSFLRGLLSNAISDDYPKDFEINDLKELSPNILMSDRKLGVNPIRSGTFASIFQEPIVYFASKQFNTKPGAFLYITRIGDLEFDFFKYDSEILVYEKEKSLGVINSNGEFTDNNGSIIAKRIPSKDKSLYSVYVNDRKIASMIKPEEVSKAEISRLFTILDIENDKELVPTLVLVSHYLRTMFLD